MTLVARAVAPAPRAVIYMSHAVPRRLLQELQAGLVAGEPVLLGAKAQGSPSHCLAPVAALSEESFGGMTLCNGKMPALVG